MKLICPSDADRSSMTRREESGEKGEGKQRLRVPEEKKGSTALNKRGKIRAYVH